MKVIFLNNQARAMYLFWKSLICKFQNGGHQVLCAVPEGDRDSDADLRKLGVETRHYRLNRKGLNPLNDLETYLDLLRLFKHEKAGLLFASTIKPVIYGCMAAKMAGIPKIYVAITGLGYVFEADTALKKIINLVGINLYRLALRNISGIFFQNTDDRALFQKLGLCASIPVHMARGTGVDIKHFNIVPMPPMDKINFLLVARLLQAKGIREYAQAAEILRKRWPNAFFKLLGPPETGPGAIDMQDLKFWRESGIIDYLGQTRDVRPFIADAHVAVLPSWREGLPTSLMEAMAMGRPVVAANSPGCREVVWENVNGFLAKPHDAESLAACLEKFLAEPALISSMGEKSRELACEYLDAQKVSQGMYEIMIQ